MCIRDRWEGPFTVVDVNPNRVAYVIQRNTNPPSRTQKVHFSHLREWIEIPGYLRKYLTRNKEISDAFFSDEESLLDGEDENPPESIDLESETDSANSYESDSIADTLLFTNSDDSLEEEADFEGFLTFNPISVSEYIQLPDLTPVIEPTAWDPGENLNMSMEEFVPQLSSEPLQTPGHKAVKFLLPPLVIPISPIHSSDESNSNYSSLTETDSDSSCLLYTSDAA